MRESSLQFTNYVFVFRILSKIGPFVRVAVVVVEFLASVAVLDVVGEDAPAEYHQQAGDGCVPAPARLDQRPQDSLLEALLDTG